MTRNGVRGNDVSGSSVEYCPTLVTTELRFVSQPAEERSARLILLAVCPSSDEPRNAPIGAAHQRNIEWLRNVSA